MAGDTLVISERLIVDIAAVSGVGDGNRDAAGTLSVRRTALIVSCGGGLEGRNGLDGYGGLGQEMEELGQMGLHPGDVLAEIFDDGFGRDRTILGVGFDVGAERGEVAVAVGLREGGHLGGDAIDLFQADLVDLGGGEVRCGEAAGSDLVAAFAASKGVDRERGPRVKDVLRCDKGGEPLIGGKDFVVDGGVDLFGEPFLLGIGEAGGELLKREDERVRGNYAFRLARHLFGDKSDGHQVILYSGTEDFLGLKEGPRNLVKPRNIVLVMLDGVERHGEREVGEADMDAPAAAGGAERHFELFEVIVCDSLLELAEEKVVGDTVLLGKPDGSMALMRAKSARSRWWRAAGAASE